MTDIEKTIEEAKAGILPYESWLQLAGESSQAFAAFRVYRDMGPERNIHKAAETKQGGKYSVWRNYASKYRWRERAADFDRNTERLKQEEVRKTVEAQGEMHRKVTGKMLEVVYKKLDTMNPEDLTQGNVNEWAQTAIKAEREAACLVAATNKPEPKQGELNFVNDFNEL